MAIPTHVADHIEAIQVGSSTFSLNADLLNGHSWSDVTDLVSTGFSIIIYTTLPLVPTSSQADKDEFYRNHRAELALIADASAAAGTYIEYVLTKTGDEPNYDYSWEQIGSTQVDLSNYVQKGTITLIGETGSAGAETVNTSSDGAQTASGTTEISYDKPTSIETISGHVHTYDKGSSSLTGSTSFLTSATGSFLSGATVSSSGVLSWSTDSISVSTGTVGITTTYTTENSSENGGHTHTITFATATATGTVAAAVSSHTHSVSISSHTHSVSVSGNNYA